MPPSADLHPLLRLTLTPGLGPVLIRRALQAFGPAGALSASPADWARLEGVGEKKAAAIAAAIPASARAADEELALAGTLGVRLLALGDDDYPPLLAELDDAPRILYVRGALRAHAEDHYPAAIVGSRRSTAYGVEQAERFAGGLARAGVTVVSGGARGVDSAAHRGALRAGGRTIAVLGCGLADCYPPENHDLFDRIAASGDGAVVSELPLRSPPESKNFPARNRLISGLSLGVIVIEAGRNSGSLITARLAAEDHGREVMAVPGRVDSPSSEGTHDLLKAGGAHLVTGPADVLQILERPARHAHDGTHRARYADPSKPSLFAEEPPPPTPPPPSPPPRAAPPLSDAHRQILAALAEPATLDQLALATGLDVAKLRVELTHLELARRVRREGPRLVRTASP